MATVVDKHGVITDYARVVKNTYLYWQNNDRNYVVARCELQENGTYKFLDQIGIYPTRAACRIVVMGRE